MEMNRVATACSLARALSRSVEVRATPDGRTRRTRVAMGDPQAPLEKVMAVLDAHDLLAGDGRVQGDVALYSMGDHFDWGGAAEADRASEDGLALLAWLAAHPPDQVHLVLGNHDLARVGEMAGFDDATFRAVRADAVEIYARSDRAAEQELVKRYPALPSAEVAARDFASYTVAQRELVGRVLRARRFRVAFAVGRDVLLTHAGITTENLARIGAPGLEDARAIAAVLDARLDEALGAWTSGPLVIPGLHEPGSAARGEGGGVFYHRPTSAPVTPESAGRRFDPRRLPHGLTQVIGHIADEKCRALLAPWVEGREAREGELRTLVTDGTRVRYAAGVLAADPGEARMVFTDGAMRRVDASAYELLDLCRMVALPR